MAIEEDKKILHYELLSCGHQNNLLILQYDGKVGKTGVCPKGCQNVTIKTVAKVDVQVADISIPSEGI